MKAQGAQAAVPDREAVEKIAFEMWEQAVRQHAQSQIKAESSQKLAALKAQFLDKVRQFTEIVESARAKAEAEARARAEAEAKLRRFVETTESRAQDKEHPAPAQPRPSSSHSPLVAAERAGTAQPARGEIRQPQDERTGSCECCGIGAVPVMQLKQIDSGQLLCPRCLAALRADAVRIRPQPSARCPA